MGCALCTFIMETWLLLFRVNKELCTSPREKKKKTTWGFCTHALGHSIYKAEMVYVFEKHRILSWDTWWAATHLSTSFNDLSFTDYTIHLFQVYNSMVFSRFHSCTSIITINFRTFSSAQKETPCPSAVTPPISTSPNPWQPLIYFPSLWICLFWTFHTNGIIQYVVLCDWLLSLSVMFQGSSTL